MDRYFEILTFDMYYCDLEWAVFYVPTNTV